MALTGTISRQLRTKKDYDFDLIVIKIGIRNKYT